MADDLEAQEAQETQEGEVLEKRIERSEENPIPKGQFESDTAALLRETQKEIFLFHVSRHILLAPACKAAGVRRKKIREWLQNDEAFKEAYQDAYQEGLDNLEKEAIRRATEGWEEPVYFKGEVVGAVNKFSDPLLMFLLKGRRHDVFKDRQQTQLSSADGEGPPVIEIHHNVDREEYDRLLADPNSGVERRIPVHSDDRRDGLGEDLPGSEMDLEETP